MNVNCVGFKGKIAKSIHFLGGSRLASLKEIPTQPRSKWKKKTEAAGELQ
jgi:hypothetical protein